MVNAALTFPPIDSIRFRRLPSEPTGGPFAHGVSGMRSGTTAQLTLSGRERGLHAFTLRQVRRLAGIGLFAFVAFALASLGTWNVADPSFSHATANAVTNAMGYPGAVFADLVMQFYGLAAVVGLVPAVAWGIFLVSANGVDRMPRRLAAWFAGSCSSPASPAAAAADLAAAHRPRRRFRRHGAAPAGVADWRLPLRLRLDRRRHGLRGAGVWAVRLRLRPARSPPPRGGRRGRRAGRRAGRRRRGRRGHPGARRPGSLVAVGARLRAPQLQPPAAERPVLRRAPERREADFDMPAERRVLGAARGQGRARVRGRPRAPPTISTSRRSTTKTICSTMRPDRACAAARRARRRRAAGARVDAPAPRPVQARASSARRRRR